MTSQGIKAQVTRDGQIGRPDLHPGLSDPAYVARRRSFADRAIGHQVGGSSPFVHYSEAEHETWRLVSEALAREHRDHACREVLDGADAIALPTDHVPQHDEVNARLNPLTGFSFTLAGGIVESRRLYGSMAQGYFHSVQYLRHPEVPFFTPEPDAIHDLIGHGIQLASPRFAELCRLIGRTVNRVSTPEAMDLISRIFWFTLEYGVVREKHEFKAFGAALLSSYGELSQFSSSEIRDLDIAGMARTPYRTTGYQPALYGARSLDHLTDTLSGFFGDFDDDDTYRSLSASV